MYIWTYIILLVSKRKHTFPLQLYSSNIFEGTKRTIWKDENIDSFIEFLYTYIWTYIILLA